MMRRMLCAWFPKWPLQRLRRHTALRNRAGSEQTDEARPFALVEAVDGAQVVVVADRAAEAAGVHARTRLSDARAICPGLALQPIDRASDARALYELAVWARRFTPWTALEPTDALALDITGCQRLFGGEDALCDALRRALREAGLTARLGLADTRPAAVALARYAANAGDPVAIAPRGHVADALAPLPPIALGLDGKTARAVALTGLTSIGALAQTPRIALARRFRAGPDRRAVLTALDAVMGVVDTPFSPLLPAPAYEARFDAASPLLTPEALAAGAARLAEDLAKPLIAADHGARALRLVIARADGSATRLTARLAKPSADPDHFRRLFAERLAQVDPGFGVDHMSLEAVRAQRLDHAQALCATLAAGTHEDEDEDATAALIDRLAARFGAHAVTRLTPGHGWLPEHGDRPVPAEATAPDWSASLDRPTPKRPLRLFDPPEPIAAVAALPDAPPAQFTWRRRARRVARAYGPERIAPEWWRDPNARPRDYYVVEDGDGRAYWLFREGLYEDAAEADRPPAWFLHGAFA